MPCQTHAQDQAVGWARAELSPAEEAMHIKRRKEVWDDLQREKATIGGGNSPTNDKRKDGRKKGEQHHKQFAADLASVMPGVGKPETAKREINRKIKRAEELGSDLHKIAGTSLDKGYRALLALSSETTAPEIRAEVIERASRGEKVTAAEIEKLKKQLLRKRERVEEKRTQRAMAMGR